MPQPPPTMLNINFKMERPTASQISEMWASLEFKQISESSLSLSDYLDAVRSSHVNGDALLYCFGVGPNDIFDWFASRNRLPEIFPALINQPAISASSPELLAGATDPEIGPKWGMPFTLAGELTAIIVSGGAYERFPGTASEAMALATEFCQAIHAERYTDVEIYTSCKPWSEWFFDVAWDSTYVILDKRKRLLWLLAITDSD